MTTPDIAKLRRHLADAADGSTHDIAAILNALPFLLDAAEENVRLRAKCEELLARLPEGMEHCTIVFKECEKGHGWLTATNWVQHDCLVCERDKLRAELTRMKESALGERNMRLKAEWELAAIRGDAE